MRKNENVRESKTKNEEVGLKLKSIIKCNRSCECMQEIEKTY